MDYFKEFSLVYSGGVTAIVAVGTLLLAGATLLFLKREYSAKYRPYVVPVVDAEKLQDGHGCNLFIIPRNVGPHPCYFKLTRIRLIIGDEAYDTPDTKEWILLGPAGAAIRMPAGNVNAKGVAQIREARYKSNRVELNFTLHTTSIEHKYTREEDVSYEIEVRGETPLALFRPEWRKGR
jgi:hypothetical protein